MSYVIPSESEDLAGTFPGRRTRSLAFARDDRLRSVRRSAVPPFRLLYTSPMPRPRRAPHVHKFGGASLADSAAVRHAVEIVRRHRPEPTVVVVSAMAGTTDALLEVAQQAGAGESRTVASLIARLRSRHAEVARSLLPGGRLRAEVLLYI